MFTASSYFLFHNKIPITFLCVSFWWIFFNLPFFFLLAVNVCLVSTLVLAVCRPASEQRSRTENTTLRVRRTAHYHHHGHNKQRLKGAQWTTLRSKITADEWTCKCIDSSCVWQWIITIWLHHVKHCPPLRSQHTCVSPKSLSQATRTPLIYKGP